VLGAMGILAMTLAIIETDGTIDGRRPALRYSFFSFVSLLFIARPICV